MQVNIHMRDATESSNVSTATQDQSYMGNANVSTKSVTSLCTVLQSEQISIKQDFQ